MRSNWAIIRTRRERHRELAGCRGQRVQDRAFCQGERNEVGPIPNAHRSDALYECATECPVIVSRTRHVGALSQGKSLRDLPRQPLCRRTRRNRTPKQFSPAMPKHHKRKQLLELTVGTTKRSIDAIPSAWLRRKVFHVCDGRPRRGTMYFETVDWATPMPSLSSSPWMGGALQSGFSKLILKIRSRTSLSICDRPPRGRDFHRQ